MLLTISQAAQIAAAGGDQNAVNATLSNPALDHLSDHVLALIPKNSDNTLRCHMVGDEKTHIKGDSILHIDQPSSDGQLNGDLYFLDSSQNNVIRVPLARLRNSGIDISHLVTAIADKQARRITKIRSFSISSIHDIERHQKRKSSSNKSIS